VLPNRLARTDKEQFGRRSKIEITFRIDSKKRQKIAIKQQKQHKN